MSLIMNQGGWTGKTLKVDLTARTATAVDTAANFGQYWGGTGMGYKAIYDAIQARIAAGQTMAQARQIAWYDVDAPVTFGWGPLTGTGALCGGRTAITGLSAAHVYSVPNTGHMGGHFSAQAKYAGWDGIIVVGQASGPVYIAVKDDDVQIVDAPQLWHCGIFKVTEEITASMGKGTQVAAIGQAGQNLVPMSTCMTAVSHSAGGIGANIGVKNLVGIGVLGSGSVKVAASSAKWKNLLDYALSIVGSNNQACVPNTLQAWAEYSPSSARWYAYDGFYWGAADPPVNTGNCDPHDRQSIGYRCFKDDKPANQTVRMDGCHACPVRCHQFISAPSAVKWGPATTAMNTCIGWWLSSLAPGSYPTGQVSTAMAGSAIAASAVGSVIGTSTVGGLSATDGATRALENAIVGHNIQDDYGITSYYGTVNGAWDFILNGKSSNGGNGTSATSYDTVGINNTIGGMTLNGVGALPGTTASPGTTVNGVVNTTGTTLANGCKPGYGGLGAHYIYPCVPTAEWVSLTSSTGLLSLYAQGDLGFQKEFGRIMAFKVGNLGVFVGGRADEQWALWSKVLSPLPDPATGAPFSARSSASVLWAAGWRLDNDLGGTPSSSNQYSWAQMLRDFGSAPQYFNWGYPKHHSWEDGGSIGGMSNTGYNRDPQNHTVVNMKTTGLPMMIQKKIMDDQFFKYYTVDFPVAGLNFPVDNTSLVATQGAPLTAGAQMKGMFYGFDAAMGGTAGAAYAQSGASNTAVQWQKARTTRFMWARKELQDSLSVCGWMYPWMISPLKERGYQGDLSLEVQYFNAVTGNNLTTLQLDNEGERFFILHRVLTAVLWGQNSSGFGTPDFMIPGAWQNKSYAAEGKIGYAASNASPSKPGIGTALGTTNAAFSPYVAPLAATGWTSRAIDGATYNYRLQHDNPCPAWGITSSMSLGTSLQTYADWNKGLELVYQVLDFDYAGTTDNSSVVHNTDTGMPTSRCYAKYGMDSSGSANIQAFANSVGLLPW